MKLNSGSCCSNVAVRDSLTHRAISQRQSKDVRQTFRASDSAIDNVRVVNFAESPQPEEAEEEAVANDRNQLADALYGRCESLFHRALFDVPYILSLQGWTLSD